jgi:hypothetical protein
MESLEKICYILLVLALLVICGIHTVALRNIAADIKVIRSTSTNTVQHAITADTVDVDNRR